MASLTMTRGGAAVARKSSTTGGLAVMELRKLAHRPLAWAVFALPSVLALAGFPIGYLTARAQGTLPSVLTQISPPGYLPNIFGALSMLGPICVAVLAAGLIGSDYGWGMMRVQVATGAPRVRLLGAKLLALALALGAWIVAAVAAATVSSLTIMAISGHSLSFGGVDAAWLGQLGLMFGRTWLVLAAWMSIAVLAAVVGRSLAAGIAAPIVWQVLEGILSSVLGIAGSFGAHVSALLLMSNASAFTSHNVFGAVPRIPGLLSQTHAVVVLGAYIALTLAVALVVFVRRDCTASA